MFPGAFREARSPLGHEVQATPRGRSFSVGYLTRVDDLILLSITVIVDMI